MTKQQIQIGAALALTLITGLGYLLLEPGADQDTITPDMTPGQPTARATGERASPSDADIPAASTTTVEGVPEFDIYGLTSYQDLLDQLGIDRDWAAWALNRGIVMLLEPELWQVYIALDEAELQALADADDVLAEFALTQKLMIERPMEAYDRIRLLVLEGSVEAMDMMQHQLRVMEQGLNRPTQSYGWSDETVAGIQRFVDESAVDLRTERMAWLLLTESYMGQPRGSTMTQDPTLGAAGAVMPIEYGAACERAQQIRQSLLEVWDETGVNEPAIEAPPIGFVALHQDPDLLDACPASELPIADLSGCRQIRLRFESTVWDDYVCPNP
ncbi:MAG: hypothetical protein WBN65_16035 [Gammaproteobacteria bacterium]